MRPVSAHSCSSVQFSKTATESEPSPQARAVRGFAMPVSQARASAMKASSVGIVISSHPQHGARTDAGRAVDVGEAEPGCAGDLTVAGLSAQLGADLVHLPQTGGADGLAVGDAAAVGVDRERAPDLGDAP